MATQNNPSDTAISNSPHTDAQPITLSNGRDFEVTLRDRATGERKYLYSFKDAADLAEQARTTYLHADTLYYDLSGKDLRGVDFSNCAGLEGAVFDGSDLSGARFGHCKLTGASFRNCDMRGASLFGADAEGADFTNSKLNNAMLRSTNATKATFLNADMTGAETHLLNLRKAHLEFARISRQQLAKTMFSEQASRMTAHDLVSRRAQKRRMSRPGGQAPNRR